MGFFDLISDAKENIEKSQKAREYISDAKRLVREADELYAAAYAKVTDYAYETESKIRSHQAYKKNIASELNSSIKNTLVTFREFNIDSKVTAPTISKLNSLNIGGIENMASFSNSLTHHIVSSPISMMLDLFISEDDYYEAKRQRDEAKIYKQQMKNEKEKLYLYRDKMGAIRDFMSEEKQELETLMSKVRGMNNELNHGMQKTSFTEREANFLKGTHMIVGQIVDLLNTEFLTDDFDITMQYKKNFENICNINRNLPSSPSISDASTARMLKVILDGSIVW